MVRRDAHDLPAVRAVHEPAVAVGRELRLLLVVLPAVDLDHQPELRPVEVGLEAVEVLVDPGEREAFVRAQQDELGLCFGFRPAVDRLLETDDGFEGEGWCVDGDPALVGEVEGRGRARGA